MPLTTQPIDPLSLRPIDPLATGTASIAATTLACPRAAATQSFGYDRGGDDDDGNSHLNSDTSNGWWCSDGGSYEDSYGSSRMK